MRLLDRYLLGDLVRVVLLTTGVLVTVIAFGAAIKPLAQNSLFSAGQTLKYILLAIVPMLQFAIPFSAGFAGTLSLHRMSSDNEVLAASVGGVSYSRMLMPVFAFGIVLTLVMVILTQWVIPRFWAKLEATVAQDITLIFQAAIERGDPFRIGDREVYADRLIVQENPEDSAADTRLVLLKVAATDLDEDGRVDKDVTAHRAILDVYRRPGVTYLKLDMFDTVAYNPDTRVLVQAEHLDFDTIVVSSKLAEYGRHMTMTQLLAVRADPDAYGEVLMRKQQLASSLRDRMLWSRLDDRFRRGESVELVSATTPGMRLNMRAASLEGTLAAPEDGFIVVEQYDGDDVLRIFRATSGTLQRHDTRPEAPFNFDLELIDCHVSDPRFPDTSNARERIVLENLEVVDVDVEPLDDRPNEELIALALDPARSSDIHLVEAGERLDGRIKQLHREIISRILKRFALSMTALLLVCLGSTLGMWLRGSLPLTIYLWAFLPSILDLLLITSGAQMIRGGNFASGLLVMWAGNLVLLAIFISSFIQLRRH